MKFRRYKEAYQEGVEAFKKCIPWTGNPYKEGSMKWISWNDGKNDGMENATVAQSRAYYRKIRKRNGIKECHNHLF